MATGATLTLKKRLEWRGFTVEIIDHNQAIRLIFLTLISLLVEVGQDSGQDDYPKRPIKAGRRAQATSNKRHTDVDDLPNVPTIRSVFPYTQRRRNYRRKYFTN